MTDSGGRTLRRVPDDRTTTELPGTLRALVVAPQPFYTERGTPIAVRYVLEALSGLGWEADLLTFPQGEDVRIPGVRIHRVANPLGFRHVPVGLSPAKLALDVGLAHPLRRMLRTGRYVVVHAVEEAALIAAALIHRDGPRLVYDMASSLPEQLAQKAIFRAPPLPALFRGIERRVVTRAGCVVCSAGLGEHVRRLAPATPVREWRFPARPPDATAEAVAALRAELGLDASRKIVLYTGNFAGYQGVDLLLDAARRVLAARQDVVFLLVGAASEAELRAARTALEGAPPEGWRLLGRQPRARIPVFLALADILVSPRSWGANFPLKLFDYLAVGVPVLATDIPGHRCVLDERIALLVPPTADGLADGVGRLLGDPELARRLGEAARRFADTHLAWASFERLIADIYATARSEPAALRCREVPA